MTRIQRIITAALAAIAAAIIPLWTPAQETWGQENTPPVIGTPASTSLQYLLPRGEKAVLDFSSEPVTDAESDATTVRFDFILTDDESDTTDPAGTLFQWIRNGHNFEFTAKDGVTPEDFTALYGNVVSHEIPVKMYANDGTEDSDPLSFTITAYHDASPQFHHSATYQSEQRWDLDTVIEVYEGPQNVTDALQIPWTSTTEGTRTWTLGNPDDSSKIKCKDQSGTTTHNWDDDPGSEDSALFEITPPGDQQQGDIPLRFKSPPDYETPQDEDQDNEYLVRLVSNHDIHGLEDQSPTLGCDGSALDLKIKVKDVGPPAPPTGLTLTPEANRPDRFRISWDHPHADRFMEDGEQVDFPHPSFNAKFLIIYHEPDDLSFPNNPTSNPFRIAVRYTGIQHIRGTPGVTYKITAWLKNSEGRSDAAPPDTAPPAEITPMGPPAIPKAPTISPESDTSIRATWEEPDNNGGQPITGYEVQYQKDGAPAWTEWTHTGTGTSATITRLDETSTYNVQVKAKNNLGASEWSPTGTGSTADFIVQITSDGDVVSGNNAVFTVTLSKPTTATVTVNLTNTWTEGYGESTPGMLDFTNGETSKKYELPTDRGNPEDSGRSVTVTINTDAAYVIGTNGSATVDIEQNSNNQPTLANPSNQGFGAVYKFPAGKTDGIRYGSSEPGTDLDGETLSYIITFTKPGTDSKEEITIPAVGSTAAVLPGTLLTIKRSDNDFIFEPDGNVTPDQFEETYGAVTFHSEEKTLKVQLWASDGKERSLPVHFTIGLHYDPSGYFPDPAVNHSISQWELPTVIETDEGTSALSGATVEWTSPLAGVRNWAAGNPAPPVFCRHGPVDEDNQDWPATGNEDSHLFTVGTSITTGESGSITFSFNAPPDYENPLDSDKDNIYKLRLHNTHDLHPGQQDVPEFPVCSGSAIDVTIEVINVNEPPEFPSETDDRSVTENTEAGQDIGAPVTATDPDPGDTTAYTLGGTDVASFDIVATSGQLRTKANLDYETKDSYTVTVTATDQEDLSDIIEVTITVTNVDEGPEVSGAPTRDYPENGTDPVAAYTATNPENGQITWSLSGDDSGDFSISNAGLLNFDRPPDFETPADADTNNVYLVTVRASDGNNADTLAVTVTITDKNEPPAFDSMTATRAIAENTDASQPIGDPIEAEDPDTGETLTYNLVGTDATSFGIVTTSGQLQTQAALDYEVKNSYTVTVTASDQGGLFDSIEVTITVTNVDETPVVAGNSPIDYPENGAGPVATYTAVDPENSQITWSLSGDDSGDFSITSGVLTFSSSSSPPNYEVPKDMDSDNEYLVTVLASDSANTASLDVTITVTDENETPVVTGNSPIDYPENGTGPVATYTASDPEGTSITWSLSGDDAEDFAINEGVLTFGSTPNFEDAADANTDNVYLATIEASDGSVKGTLDVTVTVTNVNEPPAFTPMPTTRTIAENTAEGQPIGAPVEAEDPDAGDSLTYALDGTDATSFSIIESTGQLQTKADLDHETKDSYEVTVSVQDSKDASGNADTATDATITITITVTNVNEPPEFPSTETGARRVTENTPTGRDIGLPVSATDPDADETLTYSLGGTDAASFRITESTGQLQTKANLDFEEKTSYTLSVSVHDGKDSSGNVDTATDDTVDVTIRVIGENEPPRVTGHSSVDHAENSATDVATYTASDPEGTSITWDLLGDDNSLFSISTSGILSFKTAPDFEAPADTGDNNEYLVTVRASDGDNVVTLAVKVTVTDKNEPPAFAMKTDARTIAEGTEAGVDIGTPVSATDPDAGETLTYKLGGDDATSFRIIAASGQLQTNDALNYEAFEEEEEANYTVTVTATDRGLLSDTTLVTITLMDVGGPVAVTDLTGTFRENDNSIIDLRWTAPTGFYQNGQVIPFPHAPHEVTGYAYQSRESLAEEWPEIAAATNSTSASISGLDKTWYQVRVRAYNAEDGSDWSQITVGNLPKPPEAPGTPTLTGRTTDSLSVSWTRPDDNGFTITGYGVQYRKASEETGWGDHSHQNTETSEPS